MKPSHRLVVFVFTTAAMTIAHGQTAPPAGVARVAGTVVDGATGAPIADMNVTVQPGVGPPVMCRAKSDAAGHFRCDDVPSGDFLLRATARESRAYVNQPAAEYADGLSGTRTPNGAFQLLTAKAGETVGDVTVRMWKHAEIRGRVLDGTGRGLGGVDVQALRLMGSGTPRQVLFSRSTISGADGTFDIGGNVPGEYIVAIKTQKPSLKARFVPSPTVFYPQAISLSGAQTFTLGPGDVRSGVDIRLPSVPKYSITGVVVGREVARQPGAREATGADPTTITLVAEDAPQTPEGFEVARTEDWAGFGGGGANTPPGGGFRLANVPAGRYLLRVLLFPRSSGAGRTLGAGGFSLPMRGANALPDAPTLWAAMPVEVTDHDVSDLIVPLRHGASVGGRIEFDADPARAASSHPSFAIAVAPGDGRFGVPIGPASDDGRFRTIGLLPGRFVLGPLPNTISPTLDLPEWSVQSITTDGRDVTAGFTLDTSPIEDAVITITNRPATISGRVVGASGDTRGDASVYIVPADQLRWREINWFAWPGRMRERRTRPDGTFRDLVAPGGYLIAASVDAPDDWMRTPVLESLARIATPITIQPHEARTVELRVR